MNFVSRMTCFAMCLAAAFGGSLRAEPSGFRTDWTGRYPAATPPLTWSRSKNILWAAELPSWSNATPVVMKDRLFVCSEPTTLVCLRRADGKILWKAEHGFDQVSQLAPKPKVPRTHGHNGHSSATPVVSGERVYALFGNGVVSCHDRGGTRLWIRLVELPTHGWGHSASPLVAGGRPIVQINGVTYALNPKDGKTVWTRPGRYSFGSSVATRLGGLDLIVTPAGNFLRARDGKVLVGEAAHLEYCAPLIDGDRVYFISGDARAFRMVRKGKDGLEVELLWRARLPSDRYYGSPLLHEGLIYTVTRGQKLSVVDAGTGEVIYSQKIDLSKSGRVNAVYSSPTSAGDHVFLTGLDGTTVVLAPGRAYVERERNVLERTRASPVFQGRRLYMRAGRRLYCIASR